MRSLPALLVALAAAAVPASAGAAASPYPPDSPWPVMRHDPRNTGASPIVARYHGDRPWTYSTGKGIFSSPIVGPDGAVYFGSADTYFYALDPDGTLRWRYYFDLYGARGPWADPADVDVGERNEGRRCFWHRLNSSRSCTTTATATRPTRTSSPSSPIAETR